ncbi:MAG TPA: polysaccharide biosynthesis tyrosine autokinase [Anaerolineae bacterium]|nr:polysaccharide biosynthesis tyrosine autokinase [Anaerolineae bacterium]
MTTNLITIADPRSPAAEAYRSLRINLELMNQDQSLHTLLVTSPGPDEDKSTTLANLAVCWAQIGRQVILADCDLRYPRQHLIFGLDNERGITTALQKEGGEVLLQQTGVEGLRVLTSGPLPEVPADFISSSRMTMIVQQLRDRADIVLFDAPPILSAADAAVLATRVDGVLLVVNANSTRREHAERARQLLEKVHAKLIGAVLTGVPQETALYQYYRKG